MMIIPANLFHDTGASNYPERKANFDPDTGIPLIKFNGRTGVLIIKGLYAEQANISLDHSLKALIREYLKENKKLTCYFLFRKMNWVTTESLFGIFKELKAYQSSGKNIRINWFTPWDNRLMLKTGNDFSLLFDIPLNVYPI